MQTMREILFRGKQKGNGKWVFGCYYKQSEFYGDEVEDHIIITSHEDLFYDQALDFSIVQPETVGQFTGLTDKNGKKIFEGDIIRSSNGKQSAVSVVKYGDFRPDMIWHMFRDCIGLEPRQSMHGIYCETNNEQMALFNSPTCIEVIGNIHDNPELLEG